MRMTQAGAESRFLRQLDLVPMGALEKAHVSVIGVGGLGSFAALTVAKMGIGMLDLYDGDTVEEHNVPNQVYGPGAVGRMKVEACADVLRNLVDDISLSPRMYNVYSDMVLQAPIIVTCVDSMEARAEIWKAIKQSPAVEAVIDARAGAEQLRFIYAPVTESVRYEKTLYTDEDALPLPCTARAIIYTSFVAGGIIASLVKAHLTGKGGTFRDWSMDIPTLNTLTL